MDDINNHNFLLPAYPILTRPIPYAILEDYSHEFYRICWEPANAGVVPDALRLVRKHELAEYFPHLVTAWEARQLAETEDAKHKNGNVIAFASRLLAHDREERALAPEQRGVDCDQRLLPGMRKHWGELRRCETHPQFRADVRVCKGCRVSHYAQESRVFDRQLIMARGARVPVCEDCATTAVGSHGVGYGGCVCNSHWMCFRCREAVLVRLAKAREKHVDGKCGGCSKAGNLLRHVDLCLHCKNWKTYGAPGEDSKVDVT